MQSATGVTFAEQNLHQTTLQMRALSLPPEEVEEAVAFQRLKHAYARTGRDWPRYIAALNASREEPWASLGGPHRPDDWWWLWYRSKMDVDLRPILERVQVPVFAVWGGRDQIVPVERSRAIVERALARGRGGNVHLLVVPEADHSLNTPEGPNPSRAYLDAMLSWVSERVRTS
jgi:pimeloyl-ACP methyl ester carboxylesterase